uniref:TIR domain-containing protein n=1 Tax=Ascaris lumbricoides TaxID=6252 RepID=A0A0M3IGC7_ASCLU
MAIRKAQGAMLFYSAFSPASFKQISDLISDFNYRKSRNKVPVFLICIEDEIVDDCCETSSVGQSSSEWYESETPHMLTTEVLWKTRPSMERIRACHEEGKLSRSKVGVYCIEMLKR